MIYMEYDLCKSKYIELQKKFDSVLTEKERLFTKTQPKAIVYDKDHVQTSHDVNIVEEYVVALEKGQIDDKLNNLRALLDDRWKLLMLKEIELRKSQCKEDKIYTYRYLDGYNIGRIAKILNYSKSQVYRILQEIKDATICDK